MSLHEIVHPPGSRVQADPRLLDDRPRAPLTSFPWAEEEGGKSRPCTPSAPAAPGAECPPGCRAQRSRKPVRVGGPGSALRSSPRRRPAPSASLSIQAPAPPPRRRAGSRSSPAFSSSSASGSVAVSVIGPPAISRLRNSTLTERPDDHLAGEAAARLAGTVAVAPHAASHHGNFHHLRGRWRCTTARSRPSAVPQMVERPRDAPSRGRPRTAGRGLRRARPRRWVSWK